MTKRKLGEDRNMSPGPGNYQIEKAHESILKRSPSPTIGHSPRPSWIDDVAKTDSPGPGGLYPLMHYLSNK